MLSTLRYILLTAVRDRLFAATAIAIVLITLLATFLADQAVIEGSAYSIAFAGFGIRLFVIASLVLFVALHVRRGFESREMLLILSRPVSRHGLVFAYWLGFMAVAGLLTLLAGLSLLAVTADNASGLVAWLLSLWLEAGILIAFALFFALSLPSPVAVALGTLAFYILARMIGILVAIANSEFRSFSDPVSRGTEDAAEVLGLILPRLDLFARTDWLVYGLEGDHRLPVIGAQALVYTALILVAAIHDFERKRI